MLFNLKKTMWFVLTVLVLASLIGCFKNSNKNIYNITDFGAKSDNKTNNSKAIQKAIDRANANGGGQVLVPAGGVFRAGSILLKDNVNLHIELGATLKASDNVEDFNIKNNLFKENEGGGASGYPKGYFIYGKGAKNVVISGYGTIDANGSIGYSKTTEIIDGKEVKTDITVNNGMLVEGDKTDKGNLIHHIERKKNVATPLLFLEAFEKLTIKDITLTNSSFWTVHLVGCNDVLIDGIRILNSKIMQNSDGIDPDHCKNVRINNVFIEGGDDSIVLKTTKDFEHYGNTENITISNSTLTSTSAGIKFGTESYNDFKNIVVSNVVIFDSNRGISLQTRDKGNIENVSFDNISIETRRYYERWWGKAEPIAITALDRFSDDPDGKPNGTVKNITFSNINTVGESGIFIKGKLNLNINNIKFSNINITLRRITDWPIVGYDARPANEQPFSKISGVYVENASNVNFSGLNVNVEDNFKPFYNQPSMVINSPNLVFK